jgi:hypothetical protein
MLMSSDLRSVCTATIFVVDGDTCPCGLRRMAVGVN